MTARDLMSRDVKAVRADMALPAAAKALIAHGTHGAPVVDGAGRCVGVLSVSDVARWIAGRGEGMEEAPRTCSFQAACREPGGKESTLCTLPGGACPLQHRRTFANGCSALECLEPRCVLIDWQVVEAASHLPGNTVGDVMTTTVVSAEPSTAVHELAGRMLK